MRKLLCMMLILLGLSACTAGEVPADSSIPPQPATSEPDTSRQSEKGEVSQEGSALKITVGDDELLATFVILYQGRQITIYYGVTSWNFNRLARIDDPADLKEKLGDGTVQVTFSLA